MKKKTAKKKRRASSFSRYFGRSSCGDLKKIRKVVTIRGINREESLFFALLHVCYLIQFVLFTFILFRPNWLMGNKLKDTEVVPFELIILKEDPCVELVNHFI